MEVSLHHGASSENEDLQSKGRTKAQYADIFDTAAFLGTPEVDPGEDDTETARVPRHQSQ